MPTDENRKLAPDYVALTNNTGIKRRNIKGTDITNFPCQAQKKTRREEQKIKLTKVGQLPIEGQGENEGLKRNQDKRDANAADITKGVMKKEGGRKGNEGGGGEE